MKTTWMYGLWALVFLVASERAHAFYNPTTGRWLSRDPIGQKGGFNLYGFVVSDPVGGYDKLGLKCCLLTYDTRGLATALVSSAGDIEYQMKQLNANGCKRYKCVPRPTLWIGVH